MTPPRSRPQTSRHERRPRRTCVGCRQVRDPATLVRVSVDGGGDLRVGPGPGRGAWLCGPPATLGCLADAQRRRALDRALKVPITAHQLAALRAKLERLNG